MPPRIIRGLHNGAPVIESYRTSWAGPVVGTIAIPVRDHINAATFSSMLASDFSWLSGRTIDRLFLQGNILTLQRNEAIRQMRGDWVLFVDDDMVFRPDAIRSLIARREAEDLDILGGLCFRRGTDSHPTLYMREQPDAGLYNFLETWTTDLVEVDATGLAFVIIHKRVFEKILGTDMPSYEQRLALPPPDLFVWERRLGEDIRFCQDAKAVGCRIFIDTTIEIGHVGEMTFGYASYLHQMAERTPENYRLRRDLNDTMGLPTLTHEQANALRNGQADASHR